MTAAVQRNAWSKSQAASFRECRRKFCLSSKPLAEVDLAGRVNLKDEISRLRKVKNRYLWTGSVVHETIGDLLKNLRQGNSLSADDQILEQTRDRMRKEFKDSKESTGNRLFEHEFQQAISPDVWKQQWEGVQRSLRWFLQSKWLVRLKGLGPESWKAVDEVLDFDVDGVKAYTKIDCAVEVDGRFILLDWKTSALRQDAQDALMVPALYAHEVWGADPEAIEAIAISLIDGKTVKVTPTEEALMESFLRIQEESALLQEAFDSGRADPFALPPAANQATCQRCSFQKLCFPKKA